jgi:hypothetical protein
MTLRAIAYEDQLHQLVFIHVIHEYEENGKTDRLGLQLVNGHSTWVEVAEGAEFPATYTLNMEIARKVQQALNMLFGEATQTILRMEFKEELEGIDDKLAAIQEAVRTGWEKV